MSEWFLLIAMSLFVYRLTRLIVRDDFPPVLWIRDRMVGDWREATDAEASSTLPPGWEQGESPEGTPLIRPRRAAWVPQWLADLLSCPWCASGWVSMGAVGAVSLLAPVPLPVIQWGAVWALSALLASRDWS